MASKESTTQSGDDHSAITIPRSDLNHLLKITQTVTRSIVELYVWVAMVSQADRPHGISSADGQDEHGACVELPGEPAPA